MLQLLRKASPFTVIFLFIFTLVVKLRVLLHPVLPEPIPHHHLYNGILKGLQFALGSNAFAYTLLAIILIFIQALYINSIGFRHKLFTRNTYIPAFVYLLLTSAYPRFNFFSETLILNWILTGAMDIMFSFSKTTQPRKNIYNAALLFSVAALFQFSVLSYFLLLLVGMVLFRPFNLGEWSVALLGYATPIYFFACILFLTDSMYMLTDWPHIGFSFSTINTSKINFAITLGSVISLLGFGIYAMQQNVALGNIYVRRDWTAITFYMIISIVVAFLTDAAVSSAWLITMPVISIVITHALSLEKNKRFSNFIFYFSVLFLVFCLWANK